MVTEPETRAAAKIDREGSVFVLVPRQRRRIEVVFISEVSNISLKSRLPSYPKQAERPRITYITVATKLGDVEVRINPRCGGRERAAANSRASSQHSRGIDTEDDGAIELTYEIWRQLCV